MQEKGGGLQRLGLSGRVPATQRRRAAAAAAADHRVGPDVDVSGGDALGVKGGGVVVAAAARGWRRRGARAPVLRIVSSHARSFIRST